MQNTNLSVSPFFDDFDASKNYQKVLFKPGFSVQTRELNTVQSYLQHQVERFGQHIFKEGSIVIPGNINYTNDYKAVLIQPSINGVDVEEYRERLVGKILTGSVTGVQAEVINTISESESEKDIITLYVKYTSSGSIVNNVQYKKFDDNEVLLNQDGEQMVITAASNATEYTGSAVVLNAGVFFLRGYFVEVQKQTIILDQYDVSPSYKVGLKVVEEIISPSDDSTLYDNALGSPNYSSPGADRLKITAELVKQDIVISDDSNFVELLRVEEGKGILLLATEDASIYNELERSLARRTYDESGSYTLTSSPYSVRIKEALNNGENNGHYYLNSVTPDGITIKSTSTGADDEINGDDYYVVELSEGKAYVKGFEVTSPSKKYKLVRKPRSVKAVNNRGVNLGIGSYINLSDTISGNVLPTDTVLLKDRTDSDIGQANVIALVGGTTNRIYLYGIDIYKSITLTADSSAVNVDDYIVGQTSGATAYISGKSNDTSPVLTLRQVTGAFVSGESIKGSRFTDTTTLPTVSTVSTGSLEDVRRIKKGTTFSAKVELEELNIAGSSYEVSSNVLTGTGTDFKNQLTTKSNLLIGGTEVVVTGFNTSFTSANISTGVSDGTYYNVKKLVCKLYKSNNGLTSRVSQSPITSEDDLTLSRSVSESVTTNTSGVFVLTRSSTETINVNSILVTSSTGVVDLSSASSNTEGNIVTVTTSEVSSNLSVYYSVRESNPTEKTKDHRKYRFLSVEKTVTGDNYSHNYGTRITDKDISLVYPEVSTIHAIHEAKSATASPADLFDRLVLNNAVGIVPGDLIIAGTTKAKVISISGSTVYIKYISTSVFQSGTNLAQKVEIISQSGIDNVFIKESYFGVYEDITDDFYLVRNDTEDLYMPSKLVRRTNKSAPINKFVVVYDFFEHDNLTNDLYCANSYNESVKYSDIPLAFNSVSNADMLDFRSYPTISTTKTGTGTITNPFKSSVSSLNRYKLTFNSPTLPYPYSITNLDYEIYLGRVDEVYITRTGDIEVVTGVDSETPKKSKIKNESLLLATIVLPPYLKNISDATIIPEKTRNYTMRDIGKLEQRIETVEKNVSLTLLEVDTNSLLILDEDGNNRFKNGFVVDNFQTTSVADTSNPDYSASIDIARGLMRPNANVEGISFDVNPSSSSADFTYQVGRFYNWSNARCTLPDVTIGIPRYKYAFIPYQEVSYTEQPYATRVENLTPYEVFDWIGNMELIPNKDVWWDTQYTIVEGQTIDFSAPLEFLFEQADTIEWGAWQEIDRIRHASGAQTVTEERTGVETILEDMTYDLETQTIDSISNIEFTRSRIVDIAATNLRPNTRFNFSINGEVYNSIIYPNFLTGLTEVTGSFVVGENVTLRPLLVGGNGIRRTRNTGRKRILATVANPTDFDDIIALSDFDSSQTTDTLVYKQTTSILAILDPRTEEVTTQDVVVTSSDLDPVDLGSEFEIRGVTSGARAVVKVKPDVLSNSNGDFNAFVLVPPNTFETGDLTFSLSDLDTGIQVRGLTSSFANANYHSLGTEVQITSTLTTLEVPQLATQDVSEQREIRIPAPPPPPPPPRPPSPPRPPGSDPIAQSFVVEEESGIFVTSIDLFFLTKDERTPVAVEIRTMENGIPTSTVVPGTNITIPARSVNISNDGSAATKFNFKSPIYLTGYTDYAFVVKSPTTQNYNLWVTRIGERDIATGFLVDKQPHVGVLFKSANMTTWTADQFEDIKFTLNRAKFETNKTFNVALDNRSLSMDKVPKNGLGFVQGSTTVTVLHPNHGMHGSGNKTTITSITSDTIPGLLASNISGNATNITLNDLAGNSFTNLSTTDQWNKINNAAVSGSNPGYIKIGDEIISYNGINGNELTGCARGLFGTTAVSHQSDRVVECHQLNGIPLTELEIKASVTKVISINEYEITTTSKANQTKNAGGETITADGNIQYELLHPELKMINPPGTSTSIIASTISGTSIGDKLEKSFRILPTEAVENNSENDLVTSRLILSETNRNEYYQTQPATLTATVGMSTTDDRVSPMMDVEGSKIITITNKINREVDANNNPDLSSELLPTGGKHPCYITKPVKLDNTSTSIQVLFEAIRLPESEIKVYIKTKTSSSTSPLSESAYVEIPAVSYPASNTNTEYRAFEYELKDMTGFQEFAVKVVMTSSRQGIVPKIRDFRSIALAV